MPLDSDLTPEEQRFFETGVLNAPPADPNTPAVDTVALAGLGTASVVPDPAIPPVVQQTPPVVAPVVTPPVDPNAQLPDMAEILRRNLADAQQKIAELEVQARSVQKTPQPDVGPDPSVDPLGALMHQLSTVQNKIAEMQAQQAQQSTQQQQLTAFQQFQANVQALSKQFAAATPDFDAAYAHVRNARIADLQAYGLTQQKINETIFREEIALAEAAIQQGKNPAAEIYSMAKRHGYQATAPVTPATPQATTAKLDAVAAAQNAARSLPSQPNTPTEITLENLRNASDADLNKLVLDQKMWDQISGRQEYPL